MESYAMANRGLLIILDVVEDFLGTSAHVHPCIVVTLNCHSSGTTKTLRLIQLTPSQLQFHGPLEYAVLPTPYIGVNKETVGQDKRTIVIVREWLHTGRW